MEDTWLLWKFRCGSSDALRAIYEKYEDRMLTLAIGFLNDLAAAEDVVHDVFVGFAERGGQVRTAGSLKAYLATCVANRCRDLIRRQKVRDKASDGTKQAKDFAGPLETAIHEEDMQRLGRAMAELPYEQREVIVLRLQAEMTFRAIAEMLGVSVNTTLSRYRYGLDRLRSLMDSEVTR